MFKVKLNRDHMWLAGLNKDPLVFVLGFLGCAPALAGFCKKRLFAWGTHCSLLSRPQKAETFLFG